MSTITARYYRVIAGPDNSTSLSEALTEIGNVPLKDRRKKLTDGTTEVRLETVDKNSQVFRGDMTRILKDDFPAAVEPNELTELGVNELGLCCAFLYDPDLSVLVMQYDPRRISPNRFMAYLRCFDNGYDYYLEDILDEDAWSKFNDGTVRKLKMTVAAPTNFEFATQNSLGTSLTGLAKAYKGFSITVTIGMGHHSGSLAERIKTDVRSFLKQNDTRSLVAETEEEDSPVNLLKELIRFRDELEVPPNPAASTKSRINFVTRAYNQEKAYLKKMFGDNGQS